MTVAPLTSQQVENVRQHQGLMSKLERELLATLDAEREAAAEVYDQLVREKRRNDDVPSLLMLIATVRGDVEDDDNYCLSIRFGYVDDLAKLEKLMVKQVRQRYHRFAGLKPKQVRKQLTFTVYKPSAKRGGWPVWLGPLGYYV